MSLIPIDIINTICKLAAQEDKLWYPIFDIKKGRVSWKINKFYKKSKEDILKIYHSHLLKSFLSGGQMRLVIYERNNYDVITLNLNYKSISSIQYREKKILLIYISFIHIINTEEKTFRAMLKFFTNKYDRIIFMEKEKNTDLSETYLYVENDIYARVSYAQYAREYLHLCIFKY
jgi:hypothetical protein